MNKPEKKGTREMKLLDEAKKLADDIREYAPDTNIEVMIRDLIKEIEVYKEFNAKQVDYISKQKEEYEKLWKEHMELFWKHEQDKDLTNE